MSNINPYYTPTRAEKILQSKIDGTPYTEEPQTRIEALLLQIGGGSVEPGQDFNKDDIDDVMSDISEDNDLDDGDLDDVMSVISNNN